MGCYCCPEDRHGVCYYCCCCFCCCRCVKRAFKIFFPKGAPASCVIFTLVFLCMSILFTGTMLFNQTASRSQVNTMYGYFTTELQTNIKHAVQDLLESLMRPTYLLANTEPVLKGGAILNGSIPNPELMMSILELNKNDVDSVVYELESIGVILPTSNTTAYQWNVALEENICGQYVYHVSDSSTNGTEYGYCAYKNGTISLNTIADANPAPRLSGLDQAIVNGSISETFMPVQPDFGTFVLGYEHGHSSSAIIRAEKKLSQLDDFLASLEIAEGGVAYIIETYTGYLVSSSVRNQSIVDGKRVNVTEAQDPLIRESAVYLEKHAHLVDMWWYHFRRQESIHDKGMVMVAQRIYLEGLDWVIIVTVPEDDFFSEIYKAKDNSIIFSVVMLMVSLVLVLISVNCCFAKPLKRLVFGLRSRPSRHPDSVEAEEEAFCVREFTETGEDYDRLAAPSHREAGPDSHEL